MVAKLKPLNMSFDEALTRLAKVPQKSKTANGLDKKPDSINNKNNGVSKNPPHLVKKHD